jgi:2-polyprenyl-3-methyl-5-hydroxy-6-metoxy-1,4-benzoquinol methylase
MVRPVLHNRIGSGWIDMAEDKFLEPSCPLCAGEEFHTAQLGLSKCVQCGLVVSPAIWRQQSNEALEEEWFGEGYQLQTSFWVQCFETWNNRRTLARLTRTMLTGCRLLEIGVGSGSFLQAARNRGFEVTGCDLSLSICKHVTLTHGIIMHCGPLCGLEGESCFDVVVMNHVLEHVNNPVTFLKDVLRLLAPGGVVHIAVPNMACWEAALPGWTSYEPYHLIYFTLATVQKTVDISGLSVVYKITHESFSGWFLAVLRTMLGVNRENQTIQPNASTGRIAAKKARSSLTENAYRLAMICCGGWLWPVRVLQAALGHGDEAICIARKPNRFGALRAYRG